MNLSCWTQTFHTHMRCNRVVRKYQFLLRVYFLGNFLWAKQRISMLSKVTVYNVGKCYAKFCCNTVISNWCQKSLFKIQLLLYQNKYAKLTLVLFCFDPFAIFLYLSIYMHCLITKPAKWLCTQWRLRSAWASTQSDLSLCCALIGLLRTQAFFMRKEKTDQTGKMTRLIWVFWVFARCTVILLVLTWGGSYIHFFR